MRIFAISDLHIDFEENANWLNNLSKFDYKDDILILAGDITDITDSLILAFSSLTNSFKNILFVPGNHDLWVYRNKIEDSIKCFEIIKTIATDYGVITQPVHYDNLSIIPLLGWYDYSFGEPSKNIFKIWSDFMTCKWPEYLDEKGITEFFTTMNNEHLNITNEFIITYSHFMPRIDLMPFFIPPSKRVIYPVLGTTILEEQIRKLNSNIHIFGHTHLNMRIKKDNITYINNAFGYPYEERITSKKLICVHEI